MTWLLAGLAAIAVLIGWKALRGGETLRYQMTVEVATPEGVRTGSAVREVRYQGRSSFPFGESRPSAELTGEAVSVELPGGRMLFALLKSGRGEIDYAKLIPGRAELAEAAGAVELWPSAPEVTALKGSDPLPLLVTFRDLGDPKSVERVDPADLAATWGAGYELRRIAIQRTGDPVTMGIERLLPWLAAVGRARSTLIPNPPRLLKDSTPVQLVSPLDFSTELYK
jgi:hypothetical protein